MTPKCERCSNTAEFSIASLYRRCFSGCCWDGAVLCKKCFEEWPAYKDHNYLVWVSVLDGQDWRYSRKLSRTE